MWIENEYNFEHEPILMIYILNQNLDVYDIDDIYDNKYWIILENGNVVCLGITISVSVEISFKSNE